MPLLLSRMTTAFGTIEVEDLGLTLISDNHRAVRRHRVTWTPPLSVRDGLPFGFSLCFDSYIGDDDVRRFVPASGRQLFIDKSYLAGLAILNRVQHLGPEALNSYRAMWLVFGLVRSMREHHGRKFHAARDLYVRAAGRGEKGAWSLLPADVGVDSNGGGAPWSIRYLLEHGRSAASEAGVVNPTSVEAIRYGFLEAAKLNPLEVDAEQVVPLVRTALFQIESAQTAPTTAFLEVATESLLVAVYRHLEEAADDFNAWFSGPKSTLLKLLSAKADERGNRVRRDDYRQALLHLGWEAYRYVSSCIQAGMRWVENSLEMTDVERRLFEHAFLPQSYLGGLPLVLLAERGDFLRPVILRIWESPEDQSLVPILHRLLYYYGRLAEGRREADRRFKDKRAGTTSGGLLGQDVELVEDPPALPAAGTSFRSVAERVRELHELSCDCGWGEYEAYVRVKRADSGGDGAEILYRCRCGREIGPVELTSRELRLLGENDSADW